MIENFIVKYFGQTSYDVLGLFLSLYIIWLPIMLVMLLWSTFLRYKRTLFLSKRNPVLLEIKLPKEISKSPLAMEAFLVHLAQTSGEQTIIDRTILGKVRPWFSLELASFGGEIHFYIWTWGFWRNHVEAQLYAQYPGVEVYEVDDYTTHISFDQEQMSLWGADFTLSKKDPYPIKTYVDYGLDKDPKEEFKVDPLTSTLEYLGSVHKGGQVWIQIMVRAHKDDQKKKGTWFGTTDTWKDQAKEEVDKIIKDAKAGNGEGDNIPVSFKLTPGQTDTIKALERSITKTPFEVGIRGVYFAGKDNFDPINILGLISSWKQYNHTGLNGFYPTRFLAGFDYPWQDFRDFRQNRRRRWIIDAYKRRSYFYPPHKTKPIILNSEELATIYHFPGEVASVPSLGKISSKKAGAPPNLPI